MEFICKFCGKRKSEAEEWVLGLEGTQEGRRVMKYTITFPGKWDEDRAQQSNAVHFCSSACRENYLSKNYGDETSLTY
jgi:hypothetical protein